MSIITETESSLKTKYLNLPHWQHILIWLGGGLIICGGFLFVAGKISDAWSLHQYNKVRQADIQKAQKAEQDRDLALKEAQSAMQQRDLALEEANKAHQQLVEAVGILNDATKTTEQKREAYQKVLNSPIPVVNTGDNSIDDFCARAKELGLRSAACN